MKAFKIFFSSSNFSILICISPIVAMIIWHIIDNSLPQADGSGFFFRSYSHAQHFFLESNNIFESTYKFFNNIFFERGMKPTLFPALGLPAVFLSFGDFNIGYLLLCCFYLSIILFYSYKLIYYFTQKKIFSAVSAALISMTPAVFYNSIDNISEIGVTIFLFPFFYYLCRSNYFTNANYSKYFTFSFVLLTSTRPIQAFLIILLPAFIYFLIGYKNKIFTKENFLIIMYYFLTTLVILLSIPYIKNLGSSVYIEHINNGDLSDQIFFLESFYFYITSILFILFMFFSYFIYKNKYKNFFIQNINFSFKNKNNYIISVFSLFFLLNIFVWGYQFNDLINWVYGATFGSMITSQPALNSHLSYFEKIIEIIYFNGYLTFFLISILFIIALSLNKKINNNSFYLIVMPSNIFISLLLLFGNQTDPYRFSSSYVILLATILIIIGVCKIYNNFILIFLSLILLFKFFLFSDYHFKLVENKYINYINTSQLFRSEINLDKDITLRALDAIKNYHKKYNFKKVYVDGASKLMGKKSVDSFKMRNYLEYSRESFIVGDVNVEKYDSNSYKMIEKNGFDFIFLSNPLLHDDGSEQYKNNIKYYLSCPNVESDCNISPGSLDSFKMYLDFVNKISNGTIAQTNWSLIDTIRHNNYDIFILKLKNE
mgnify:CR=1 FL=1